jgi:AcrR family transcriptional regulator
VPETRKPRQRPDEGAATALIDATIQIVTTEGIAAATTRRIAEVAGLPLGAVHYWFASKEDLFGEVVRTIMNQMETAVEESTRGEAEKGNDLLTSLRAAWKFVEGNDPLRELMLFEIIVFALRNEGLKDLARTQYEVYRKTAHSGVASWLKSMNIESTSQQNAVATLIAVVFDGLTIAWLADPEGTKADDVLVLLSELMTRGLRVDSP